MSELFATMLVSRTTGKGRIDLHCNDKRFAQLSPDQARAWAMNILEAAEAAETDAFLCDFIGASGGPRITAAFRVYRDNERAVLRRRSGDE